MISFYSYLTVYILIINLVTAFVYFLDKQNAKKNLYRVSEKTLILLAVIGGSVGALSAMFIFRHKTKHLLFTVGIPLIIFLQLALGYFLFF